MQNFRLIFFVVLSCVILFFWDSVFNAKTKQQSITENAIYSNNNSVKNDNLINAGDQNIRPINTQLATGNITKENVDIRSVLVTTDTMQVKISTLGADLREVNLLHYGMHGYPDRSYQLMTSDGASLANKQKFFVAQTGIISGDNSQKLAINYPNHKTIFNTDHDSYTMHNDQHELLVRFYTSVYVVAHQEENNTNNNINKNQTIDVIKTYRFIRGSYVVYVEYEIVNHLSQSLADLSIYWRLLTDKIPPQGETQFTHTYFGPVYYNKNDRFNKLEFSSIENKKANYASFIDSGWVGLIEHYFAVIWLLDYNNNSQIESTCGINSKPIYRCRMDFRMVDSNENNTMMSNLFSIGVFTDLKTILGNSSSKILLPLYLGPQDYNIITHVSPDLELIKDYGWVHIFASPLFWLMLQIYNYVFSNWGVAIILLTVLVKFVLYPLTKASFVSMAKMKQLAPRMEQIKLQYKDDKLSMQKAIMVLYKQEKLNPLGGCLPILLQIPVFIGLYWALLASVELREATFLWINDLSQQDPYYIMPVILTLTTILQVYLNPQNSATMDPIQAKMLKIMPIMFSVMFFFFPAGLVLYWTINNLLSIIQQWYVNKKYNN